MDIPKTIVGRKKMLQGMLTQSVAQETVECIRLLFRDHYTPDAGDEKYDWTKITNVSIGTAGHYGSRCFYIHLADGSSSTVSYKRLAGEKPPTTDAQLFKALRYNIQDQIDAFRAANPLDPAAPCPIDPTRPLGPDAEVDHDPTFASLCEKWLSEVKSKPKTYYDSQSQHYHLTDPSVAASWASYHQRHATLRYLSKEGHRYVTLCGSQSSRDAAHPH